MFLAFLSNYSKQLVNVYMILLAQANWDTLEG